MTDETEGMETLQETPDPALDAAPVEGLDEADMVESVEAPADPRPLMTTSFRDYTVTEGLLLLILLLLVVRSVVDVVRRWV